MPHEPLRPTLVFPSSSRLERLVETEAAPREADPALLVESWEGQNLPANPAEYVPDARQVVWTNALAEAVGTRASASTALHCFAEQAGRFVFEHGAAPEARLTQYMASRCGIYAPAVTFQKVVTEVPAAVPDSAVFEAWRPKLQAAVGQAIQKAPSGTRLGVWFGRDEHRTGLVLAMARYEVELSPVTVSPQGVVRISGRATEGTPAQLDGLLNQGTSGVGRCEFDVRVQLPKFAMSCQLAPGDIQAWFELQAYDANRLLGRRVARVLVRRGSEPSAFAGSPLETAVVSSPAEFSRVALAQLNAVRRSGNMAPLVLAKKQSALSTKVAARMLAAGADGDTKTADLIALGLLAGWRVPGVIRNAAILSSRVQTTHDASAWVAAAMESPVSRAVLLDPDARQLAFGGTIDRPYPGLGVVATTYALFDSTDHADDRRRFIAALAQRRVALGKRAPVVVEDPVLLQETATLAESGKHPMDIVSDAMDRSSAIHRSSVQGTFFTGNSMDQGFPDELLEPLELHLSVAVTHVKLPDAAWGQYVVLVVVIDRPPAESSPRRLEARRARGSRRHEEW